METMPLRQVCKSSGLAAEEPGCICSSQATRQLDDVLDRYKRGCWCHVLVLRDRLRHEDNGLLGRLQCSQRHSAVTEGKVPQGPPTVARQFTGGVLPGE